MSEFHLKTTPILPGLSVIEASAGTGKTWTIAHLIPRLLIQGQLETLAQAVLVTFTEDAARELGERVRKTLLQAAEAILKPSAQVQPEEGIRLLREIYLELADEEQRKRARLRLENALDEAGQLQVSTIHAFCRRVLSQEAFLCGMPPGFELLGDAAALQEEVLRDQWRERLAADPLLASAAAAQGWTLAQDLKTWRLVEPLEPLRLHPTPLPLAEAGEGLRRALRALRDARGDLELLAQGLEQGLRTNQSADPSRLTLWREALAALDEGAPSAWLLGQVQDFARLDQWFNKRGAGGALVERLARCSLVQAAQATQAALNALRWAWIGETLARARQAMEERLRQSHASTYHGLIESLHRALRHPQHGAALVARLRKTWRLALVDESQDSDPLQLEIFEKIFNRELESGSELQTYLLLVGDPKQAIYGFRGADLRAYQDAAARAGGAQRSTLLTNHRSAPGLLKALQALWERAPAPLGDPRLKVERVVSARSDASLPPPQGSARLELALAPAEDLEAWKRAGPRLDYAARAAAAAVRSRLGRLMGERPLGPGDCCVLVRSNREAQAVGQALRALGIPHVVRDDGDVLRCDEAVELLQVLRALLKPASRRLRRSALATRLLGLDAATLSGMDEAEDEAWRLRLAALAQTWSEQGLAACLAGLERGWPEQGLPGVLERLSLEPDAERRLTDWRHVVELLLAQPAAQSGPPEKLLHGFEAAQAAAEDFATQEQRLRRLEQDGAAVQVLTMHRAKGLEFELVFCPTLWSAYEDRNQRIPRLLRMADGRRALCDWTLLDEAQREQLQSEADWERLQEDLRLTYVALTRARRALWILVGPLGYSDNSNSVLPPSALDWLQRPLEEGEEDGPQWCRRCRRQKRVQPEDLPELGRRLERLWSAVARTEELRLQAVDLKAEPWTQSLPAAATLRMRRLDRPALPFWRLSSFSGLVRGGEDPPPRERWDPAAEEDEAAPLAPLPLPLHAFPKGRQVGDALHEILQHWDFGTPDPERLRSVLRRHGLELPLPDGGDPAVLLAQLLPTWAHVRLPGLETTLGVAARDARLSEWAFMLPLGGEGISGEGLARIFGRHARSAEEADYALRLRGLPQVALQGFLHGYIDRLLQHQNRWAVLDWKSNHLGPLPQDYEAAALWRVAAEHHYILQLHLYLLALRRHLRRRQPQAVLAGAGLAFLRGLQAGSERGILWLRPDEALLDDLEACCLEGVA